MLRQDLLKGVSRVLKTIEEAGLMLAIRGAMAREKTVQSEQILAAFSRYMQLYQAYTSIDRQIVEILDLNTLHNIKFWALLLAGDDVGHSEEVFNVFNKLRYAQEHLPRFLALLKREADEVPSVVTKAQGEETAASVEVLTVLVLEETGTSSPARLVLMLESIQGLYDAASQILGKKGDDLSVIGCDSGSDKSFDFLGAAKIVNCVKDIILSFWNKVVYFREDKSGRQLELISTSLPILEKIANLKDKGQLEPERAELLKRQVIDSVHKFAQAGVTIPEIEQYTVFNPRQLMRPEPKLLVAPKTLPKEETPKAAEASGVDLEDPEFKKYLAIMAAEFLKQKSNRDSSSQPPETGREETQPEDPGDKE